MTRNFIILPLLSLLAPCLSFSSAVAFSTRSREGKVVVRQSLRGNHQYFLLSSSNEILTVLHASNNQNENELLSSSIPSTPLDRPLLALMDLILLLVFASIGKASHSDIDGSIDLIAVAKTAGPFVCSWFVVTPFLGCFTPMATGDLKGAALTTTKGWIVAIPLGCVIRGIFKGYVPPLPFVIVTLIATWVLLVGGRAIYTALSEVFVEMV
jgi:hypothetical protein